MTKGQSALARLTPASRLEIGLIAALATLAIGGVRSLTQERPAAATSRVTPPADPGVFARFDAFHRAGTAPPGVAAEPGLIGWRLVGTRTGADASAILQRPDGAQIVLRRGEATPGAPELRHVAVDHVVLIDGGREVRLEFSDDPPPPPAPPEARAALGADAGQAAAAMGLNAPTQDVYASALRPQTRDGVIEGFVWRRGAAGGALAQLGLREGDVILSVAGEPLTSEERVAELAQILASGRPVEVRYRRGSQILTATLAPATDR
ncbi:MAG TPA: PDZ domain-containing protein [Brevundimonas sp.]|jgi:type II secretory pathway component PulC|uniref:PDZ domain-containing protein n=1 Tax=Brevundimonas sp. TaxID=1871086 RepID=UPI002DF0A283|nr:PDZ domain-containing protein [Brevundimonas sp.]